jgi:hypothetical protein
MPEPSRFASHQAKLCCGPADRLGVSVKAAVEPGFALYGGA